MKIRVRQSDIPIPLLLGLRIASGVTANLSYLLTALYALRSPRHAIEALFLSFIFINLNAVLFPSASLANLARYMIVLFAMISVFGRDILKGRIHSDRIMLMVIIFGLYSLVHSIVFSQFTTISVLKITIWTCTFLTLIRAWNMLSQADHAKLEMRIYAVLSILVVLSLFSQILPAAYLPRTSLLRGLFNHSQALGSTAVIVAVWSFMRAVQQRHPSWINLGIFGCATLAILSSGARTALVTLAVTLVLVGVLSLLKMGQLTPRAFAGFRSTRVRLLGILAVGMAAIQIDLIRDVLIKSAGVLTSGSVDLVALYAISRGGLIGEMWANIASDPLIGIGFGLASDPHSMIVTYAAGIPIGAIVEKGVTLVSIWEELGIVGLLLFFGMMLFVFVRAVNVLPQRVAVFVAIVFINFGEASLMSAGGFGLVQLVLLGWIISSGNRTQNTVTPRYPSATFHVRPT